MAKGRSFSDELRQAIETSEMSRYSISQQTGITQSTLSRFMNHRAGLSTITIDRLADLLDLELKPRNRKRQ